MTTTELITPWEEIALEEGFAKGQAEGLAKGRVEGLIEGVLNALEIRFGAVPEGVQLRLSRP